MMDSETRELVEDAYGMPAERLMYHLYWEREMSSGEIANEIAGIDGIDGVYRSNVRYWLQKCGIKMRSRTLSDVQRLLIIAYIDAGLGDGSVATKTDCGQATVNRYRKDLVASGGPTDLEMELQPTDRELLEGKIRAWGSNKSTDTNSQVTQNET